MWTFLLGAVKGPPRGEGFPGAGGIMDHFDPFGVVEDVLYRFSLVLGQPISHLDGSRSRPVSPSILGRSLHLSCGLGGRN